MADDTSDLAAFGYKQVLDRTLGSFSSFAAGFSYISVLTWNLPDLLPGICRRRPCVLLDLASGVPRSGAVTVLCFAELAVRYPLSGGIYQWSRRLSNRGVGWMTGWVYLCGAVISLAAVALLAASSDSSPDRAGISFDR